MNDVIETITGTTHTATLYYDQDTTLPLDYDTVGLMAVAPRDYYTQRSNRYRQFDKQADGDDARNAYYRIGVDVHSHSGEWLQWQRITPGFLPEGTLEKFDYIYYTTRKRAEQMHSGTKTTSAQIWEAMETELQEYDKVFRGEVYGIVITHNETDETADSCWRFIGFDYAMESAREMLTEAEKYYHESEFDTYRDVA